MPNFFKVKNIAAPMLNAQAAVAPVAAGYLMKITKPRTVRLIFTPGTVFTCTLE